MDKTDSKQISLKLSKYYRQIEPALEKPKVRVYATVVFTFLAISLFGWYAIRPTLQTIIYLQREIKDKEALNDKMEQKIANLIEAQAAYQEAQPLLTLLDEAIPELPNALDLTLQIRNVSDSKNTPYSDLSFGNIPLAKEESKNKTVKKASSNSYQTAITWNGEFPDLDAIIQDIHAMRRLTLLKQLRFAPEDTGSRASGSANAPQIQLDTNAEAFYK